MTPSTLSTKLLKEVGKAIPLLSLLAAILIDEFILDMLPFVLVHSCLFYWSIYQPEFLPFSGLCVLSLVADGLAGTPFGRSFLLFLCTLLMAQSQQRSMAQASFGVIWTAFAFYMMFFVILRYVLDGLLSGAFEPAWHLLQDYLAAVSIHPIVFFTLVKIKWIPEKP